MRCFAALLLAFLASDIASAQIFVSPQGKDSDRGTAAHPALMLQHALELSRRSQQHKIVLAEGTYRLTQPRHLTSADAGLIMTAAVGAHPIISGAVRIREWHEIDAAHHLWSARVLDVFWIPSAIRGSCTSMACALGIPARGSRPAH